VVYKRHRAKAQEVFHLVLHKAAKMSEKKEIAVDVADANESSASSLKDGDKTNERSFDEKRTKNLLHKMDRNIVPFLSLLYL